MPTHWNASVAEILDVPADALICSANPQLNLSGGVGGSFATRYGYAMQEYLHRWLATNKLVTLKPGSAVVAPACGSPFRCVIHAVAIDVFYDTSRELIRSAYDNAFLAASNAGCRKIATACLACGYGRASPNLFISTIRDLLNHDLLGVDSIHFASLDSELICAIQDELLKQSSVS